MEERETIDIPRGLAPEGQETPYFPVQTKIWLRWKGRRESGSLTQKLQVRELPGEMVEGLKGWEAEGKIHLYFNGRFWERPTGTHIGAYAKNVRGGKAKRK